MGSACSSANKYKTIETGVEVAGGRLLSLPKSVAAAGGPDSWNNQPGSAAMKRMLDTMVSVRTADEALVEVKAMIEVGNLLWAHMWMKMLQEKNMDLYYEVMTKDPTLLLPVMYTPTVGEVCQKFGKLPFYNRGCYLSITDRGKFREALQEYAMAELEKDASGTPLCDCIVFSDGGRILGLGDLGAWGMGIPLGKLDLYTVCGGVNPRRVIPLILDMGCGDASKNTDGLKVRDDPRYTGLKQDRVMTESAAGTMVNKCYYGSDNVIEELFEAATSLFGRGCLLQFEDFNSNDAFPLLANYREKYLTYNDDIQGTAAVAVAGIMGGVKMKDPDCTDLVAAVRQETILFFGAGSANIGCASLLVNEAKVDRSKVMLCGSKGLIWASEDGSKGTFKNNEQKEFAYKGKPSFPCENLTDIIKFVKPTILVGAVGVSPNCFTKDVVDAMMTSAGGQPIIFALSNPKTQAEITAENVYRWTAGAAIFGSGTFFEPIELGGKVLAPGQVNNVYIFPGMSFGAICCQSKSIPERLFLAAAEAVAHSLTEEDFERCRVIPERSRVQEVNINVATAVVLESQRLGLAGRKLGADAAEVKAKLQEMMWVPGAAARSEFFCVGVVASS